MSSLAELVALARSLVLPGTSSPILLGIVGPPGSGKSFLTESLAGALPEWSSLQMDGYHLSNEVLLDLGRRDRKGAPDTFDVDGFVELLLRVRRSCGVVYAPRFHRSLEEPVAGSIAVNCSAPGIIVEGNYLLHDAAGWASVAPLLDEIWYVDTPPELCRARLMERATLTYGPVDGPQWVDQVDEPNAALVRASGSRATRRVVLNG